MNKKQKYKDPRWQKKRLEILERDSFQCQCCRSKEYTLHIHHLEYGPYDDDPWDVPSEWLTTLCEGCHKDEGMARKLNERRLISIFRRTGWFWERGLEIDRILTYLEEGGKTAFADLLGKADKNGEPTA